MLCIIVGMSYILQLSLLYFSATQTLSLSPTADRTTVKSISKVGSMRLARKTDSDFSPTPSLILQGGSKSAKSGLYL